DVAGACRFTSASDTRPCISGLPPPSVKTAVAGARRASRQSAGPDALHAGNARYPRRFGGAAAPCSWAQRSRHAEAPPGCRSLLSCAGAVRTQRCRGSRRDAGRACRVDQIGCSHARETPMKHEAPLNLHIPEARFRPGDKPDFSYLQVSKAGEAKRPKINAKASETRELAYGLVRVLDVEGNAVGPWNPKLDPEALRRGLRAMMLTRAYDDRMYRMQRQGKTSFYLKCTGEEAVAVGQAFALEASDMCFASYRQQGILIARDWPILDIMNQIYSNSRDRLKGRQLPVLYSAREAGFFTISGNLATQYPQAVGWAMASAYKRDRRIAAAWIGEGASAEGDFHHALTFGAVY